jgi:predicted RNA binding protein YcfA (HicA-like mRNA interferase family)
MGRLGGFRYREVTKRLKKLGFEFDRQAAGSHEIWYNPATKAYTTIPNRNDAFLGTPTLLEPGVTSRTVEQPRARLHRHPLPMSAGKTGASLPHYPCCAHARWGA